MRRQIEWVEHTLRAHAQGFANPGGYEWETLYSGVDPDEMERRGRELMANWTMESGSGVEVAVAVASEDESGGPGDKAGAGTEAGIETGTGIGPEHGDVYEDAYEGEAPMPATADRYELCNTLAKSARLIRELRAARGAAEAADTNASSTVSSS
jgi:hypothetical protein